MRARLVLTCLLLVAGVLSSPARAADADSRRIDAAVVSRSHKAVRFSVGVWDAATGEMVYGRAPAVARRPASVMKLATTGAALLALGPDGELRTQVLAARHPDTEGVLRGDLVVRGGGDPGFCGRFHDGDREAALRDLARAVVRAGVRRVQGDLVLDDTAFPGPARHPSWNRRKGDFAWFTAPVSALVLNDNCLDVLVLPGPESSSPGVVRGFPATGTIRFVNLLATVTDRKDHLIRFEPTSEPGVLRVTGGVWTRSTGYREPLACVDPPAFFGDVFRRLLVEEGVTIRGGNRVRRAGGAVAARPGRLKILTSRGTPVRDVVDACNRRSQNLYAELLLRAVGRHGRGDGTFEGGAAAVRKVLGFSDKDTTFKQIDGSGLSRGNRMSVEDVGRVLRTLYRSPHRLVFMKSLALGGDPGGTLRKRFKEERFRGRVLAKTGTLRDTSSLGGYVRAGSGRVFAFAVLCEGDPSRSRRLQDAVVRALVDG